MWFMYKCSNDLVPDYISDIIPPLIGEVSNYSLRNRQNLANVYTRTEVSRRSCIPSSVSSWNNLSNDMREADTYLSFRNAVKMIFMRYSCPLLLHERSKAFFSLACKNSKQL